MYKIFLFVTLACPAMQTRVAFDLTYESDNVLPLNTDRCTCVPLDMCDDSSDDLPYYKIDIRFGANSCEDNLEVCCVNVLKTPRLTTKTPLPIKTGCGYRNMNGVFLRITGDTNLESQFGEFPWMVGLVNDSNTDSSKIFSCGGALIHPKLVLTAAHCIVKNKPTKVRVGEWDTQSTQAVYPYQERTIETHIIHNRFNKLFLLNDIALVVLSSPVELTQTVQTICVPSSNVLVDPTTCLTSGWGEDSPKSERRTKGILKKIDVHLMSNSVCQQKLRNTTLGPRFPLHQSFTCAGGQDGMDSCRGDGGGPLICQIPNAVGRYYQVGITSWGLGCGMKDVPGVYVNLPLYRKWIDAEVNKLGLTQSFYTY